MNNIPQLYLKLFGKPRYCFQTQTSRTPLLPLPTPLWAMVLAYLAACDNQAAPLDVLQKIWNEALDEKGKVVAAYSHTDTNESAQIAKAALATAIAKARQELIMHCRKALENEGVMVQEDTFDKYTFLPKHQEKTIYLNPQLVNSDVGYFSALLKQADQLHNSPDSSQHQEQIRQLLQQAKALYDGVFMEGGDTYFGRADFRRGGQADGRVIRPWVVRTRALLAGQFAEVNSRLHEDARSIFKALPTPLDHFVRRTKLSQQIHTWLLAKEEARSQPLLMLHGPGGAGKTRLAIESVRNLHETALRLYHDRIHFVSFEGFRYNTSISNMVQTIASSMNAPTRVLSAEPESISERLHVWLTEGPVRLLVLDNFESVTVGNSEAGAWLIDLLKHTNGKVRCLVTSQHSFAPRLPHYEVGGMEIPVSEDDLAFDSCECTALFLSRVKETIHHQDYKLNRTIRRSLFELFTTVSGLPLAIEILAARCARMDPSRLQETIVSIRNKIEFLQDADDLLKTLPRHTGMRACITWTWELLPVAEQILFARLGVFPNTFTEEAARTICEVTQDHLHSWANLALVGWDDDKKCWSLLPLIREFAFEQLSAGANSERFLYAFCRYYLNILEDLAQRLQTKESREVAKLIDNNEQNFVIAQQYCAETQFVESGDFILRYAIALRSYRFLRSERFRTVDELETAVRYGKDRAPSGTYRLGLCTLITSYGQHTAGSERMEALRTELDLLCTQVDELSPEDLRALGTASVDIEQSIAYLEAAIEGYTKSHESVRKVVAVNALASLLGNHGQVQKSLDLYTALLPEAIESGWYASAMVASNAASSAVELGNEELAEKMFRASLELCQQNRLELIASWVLLNYAQQQERLGNYAVSTRLFGYGERLRRSVGGGYEPLSSEEEDCKKRLSQILGERAFDEVSGLASRCTIDSAINYALSIPICFP